MEEFETKRAKKPTFELSPGLAAKSIIKISYPIIENENSFDIIIFNKFFGIKLIRSENC